MSGQKDMQRAAGLEAELNKERAGALGLTAQKLERLLAQCAALAAQLATTSGAGRAGLLSEYREVRALAEQQRWYLCIQREAVGLRVHDDVDRLYPPPPVIQE